MKKSDLFSLKEDTDGMCRGTKDSGSFETVILSKGRQTEKGTEAMRLNDLLTIHVECKVTRIMKVPTEHIPAAQ